MNPCLNKSHDWRFDGFHHDKEGRRVGLYECVRCGRHRIDRIDWKGQIIQKDFMDPKTFLAHFSLPDPPTPAEMARMRQELLDEIAALNSP